MNGIKTSLGTYVHSAQQSELAGILKPKTATKPRKSTSKRIKAGAEVLYCGRPGKVISKHPANKGWWVVEIDGPNGKMTTSGDRKQFKIV